MKTKLLLVIACMPLLVFADKKVKLKKKEFTVVFNENIVELAKKNTFFRKEVVTGKHSQVVLMSIPVGQDIGQEVHADVDQTLIFVQGHGQVIINNTISEVHPNHLVFVPAGTQHNFKNIGNTELKLFTIYAPAEHKPGTIEKTKTE
jgi:mannose-6-phosphate isomerase-like protein (cupin superfamily)